MSSEGDGPDEEAIRRPSDPYATETGGRAPEGEDCSRVKMPPVVETMIWVIFPEFRWIKIWDTTILLLLCFVAFVIPYTVGVSGGRRLLSNIPWLVCNVLINTAFFVDTILYFFRAYRDGNGRLVFNLRKIRKRYLKTFFIPNMMSSLPTTLIFYFWARQLIETSGSSFEFEQSFKLNLSVLIKLFDLTKLIRFVRVGAIISSSNVITDLRQKNTSYILQMLKYIWLIITTSHLFACTWSFVAFAQVNTFGEELASTPNWIAYWVENNTAEGGLNPIGWTQDTERYVLSLFWAIQTITSIGYGNVMPLTPVEWWVASILQLIAGVMWAYVIGGLVGVAAYIDGGDEVYRTRIDQANALIREFSPDPSEVLDESESQNGTDERKLAAESIRRYLPSQTRKSQNGSKSQSGTRKVAAESIRRYLSNQRRKSQNAGFSSSPGQRYPVLEALSPQMKRTSIFLIARDHLETIPYISSRFLSSAEQSFVTEKCTFLEFPAGENLELSEGMNKLGRGVFLITEGAVSCVKRGSPKHTLRPLLMIGGSTIGADEVLLEDGVSVIRHALFFMTYTKVIFIPRNAVMAALSRNPKAWKDCARWRYLKALLLWGKIMHPEYEDQPNEIHAVFSSKSFTSKSRADR